MGKLERTEREFWPCWPTVELLMAETCPCFTLTPSSYSASKRSFVWPVTSMIALLGWFEAFSFITSVFLTKWLDNFPLISILLSRPYFSKRSQFYWHQWSLFCTTLSISLSLHVLDLSWKDFYNKKSALNVLARFYCHIRSFHVRNVTQKPPSINKYWVHYSWQGRPPRPITDSRFSIFSFVRIKYLSK